MDGWEGRVWDGWVEGGLVRMKVLRPDRVEAHGSYRKDLYAHLIREEQESLLCAPCKCPCQPAHAAS